MVYALRDPVGANLDRIEIVKGWMDAKGNTIGAAELGTVWTDPNFDPTQKAFY